MTIEFNSAKADIEQLHQRIDAFQIRIAGDAKVIAHYTDSPVVDVLAWLDEEGISTEDFGYDMLIEMWEGAE